MKYIIDIPKNCEWIETIGKTDKGVITADFINMANLVPYTKQNPTMKEIWSFIAIIKDMNVTDRRNCFGVDLFSKDDLFLNMPYQEAKEKFEKWTGAKFF